MTRLTVTAFLLAVGITSLRAASPTPTAPTNTTPPPPACVAPEFRQFDFWIGHWKVLNPQGIQVGTSEISRVSEGCAIREQWQSANGKGGTSINYYADADREWHQDWVGGDGSILHLHGGMKGNAMTISGETKGAKGPYLNRITYTPLPGEKVEQKWSVSSDAGKSWQIVFLGIYQRQN